MYAVKFRSRKRNGVSSVVLVTMTTTNRRNWGSHEVRIAQPLLERFEVCELEPRIFPRTLRAIAEWGHPLSAGFRDRLETDDPQDRLFALCELGEEEVALEGLVAREPALLGRLSSTRAWAAPTLEAVAHAVFHAHMRVFEGRQACVHAAVQVLLCEPLALTCRLGLVHIFLGI